MVAVVNNSTGWITHTTIAARFFHALIAGIALFSIQPIALQAQSIGADTIERGKIDLQAASLRSTATGWDLLASADIQLSPVMRRGLNSGVPLQFIVDFRLKEPREFWFDKTVLVHQHRYSLVYYELTRHYRLQSLVSGQSRNFRSLLAALDELGRLKGVHVPKPDNFDDRVKLLGALSLRLDDKALPLPLQPLLSSRWKLASEEFAWSLN